MSKQQTSLSGQLYKTVSKAYEAILMKIRIAFGKGSSTFGSGQSQLGSGYSSFGSGRSTFGSGQSGMSAGRSSFGAARAALDLSNSKFGEGQPGFGSGRSVFGAGQPGFALSGKSLRNKGKAAPSRKPAPRKTGQTSRDKLSDQLEATIEQDFQACEQLMQDGTGRNDWVEQNCPRRNLWQEGAEAGDPRAQVLYGLCFYYGHGEEEDEKVAEKWFRLGAEQDNVQAQASLGQLIYYLDDREAEAVEWLHKSAAARCSWSQYLLGRAYYFGHGVVDSDEEEGERWYRLAMEQGNLEAQFSLGQQYSWSSEASKKRQGRIWIEQAAQKGHQEATEWIAEQAKYDVLTVDKANQMVNNYLATYKEDSGVEEDEENEFNWYDMNDFRQIDEAAAEILAACKGDLDLSGLESISADVVRAFCDEPWSQEGDEDYTYYNSVSLDLSGLVSIDLETLELLVNRFDGLPDDGSPSDLALNGLQELSVEQAQLLSSYRGGLNFNGLEAISDDVLEALSQHEQNLTLNGMKTLSVKAAEKLRHYKGNHLELNRLTELSKSAAKALGAFQGDSLLLDGLKSLSPEAAENLLRRRGEDDYRSISLDGLTTLSEPVARSRVGFLQEHDSIYLPNLEDLTPDVAQVVASGTHYLYLTGLKQITNEVAEILASQKGESLSLDSLSELSDQAAYLLSKYEGSLSFNGITELSDVAAEHLGEHRGGLSLYGLESLSETAASHLSTGQGDLGMHLGEGGLSGSVADILRSHPSFSDEEEEDNYDEDEEDNYDEDDQEGNRESLEFVRDNPVVTIEEPEQVLTNSVGMKFLPVESGEFLMGEADCSEGENQAHHVRITRPYWLGMLQVTQEQYEAVMDDNPSFFSGPQLPVEHLSWLQATEYAECLSALEEEKAAGRSYRLPTEAEWEYACRAGTTTDFAFGSVLLPSEANFSENGSQASAQQTCPVGSFQPNDWGFYDMHGNVWEWCSDWFDDEYYGNSPADDPGGPEDGSHHTLRGGAASNAGYECSSYSRGEASSCDGPIDSSPAWGRYEALGDFGIRLVCEINLGEDGHDDEDDDESLGGDGNGETGGVQERFFRIVSDQVSVAKDKLTLETSFGSDLGADSLDLVELVMEVEEEFGIHIPEGAADKIQTVGQAIDAIEKSLSGDDQEDDDD